MWLDSLGLEQATSEAVARYKACRFDGPLIVDLCAGIGGDSIALAGMAPVLAVDCDHGRCRRIGWNAEVYGVADRILVCRSRAESIAIPQDAWVHVDPDRRAAGPDRARRIAEYSPGIPFLRSLMQRVSAGAIKLGPASDFARQFPDPECEIELISLSGECKEATLWFGAAASCRRRATRLPESVTWTDRDAHLQGRSQVLTVPVSQYLYDPDPALLRSGLLDGFAAAHDLCRIATDVDYLTAPHLVATPFLSAFRVEMISPFDMKQLKRLIVQQDIGPLEIKLRGLRITPQQLRSQLRSTGSRPATLILIGGRERARAVLAERLGLQ